MHDLHALLEVGDLTSICNALAAGADINAPGHCGATPLMTAISQRNVAAVVMLLAAGADPELTNDFNHTALAMAVQNDAVEIVHLLLRHGVDLGHNPKYPRKKVDYRSMIGSLPPEIQVQIGETLSGDLLDGIGTGAPPLVMADVNSVEVLRALLEVGEQLADAPRPLWRQYFGLAGVGELPVTVEAYHRDRRPRPGRGNPERVDAPFWRAMVSTGVCAYAARQRFDDQDLSQPVWCADRFGHSLTALPDGRWVGIAGEHEDSYDPDFAIYNDVIIYDGEGGFEILAYPHEVFPPTDFHTATLVGDAIYIIGTLGYPDHRHVELTPVYRLDLQTWEISTVATVGEPPGWISRHRAGYDVERNVIHLHGGCKHVLGPGGKPDYPRWAGAVTLDLTTMRWATSK